MAVILSRLRRWQRAAASPAAASGALLGGVGSTARRAAVSGARLGHLRLTFSIFYVNVYGKDEQPAADEQLSLTSPAPKIGGVPLEELQKNLEWSQFFMEWSGVG